MDMLLTGKKREEFVESIEVQFVGSEFETFLACQEEVMSILRSLDKSLEMFLGSRGRQFGQDRE